jgi:hypothetical protein
VTAATVNEVEKLAYIAVSAPDGRSRILKEPMTDDELADYRIHREAYFGRVRKVDSKPAKNEFELFEWFVSAHRKLSRAQLLTKLAPIFPAPTLAAMRNEDLLLTYCEQLVASTQAMSSKRPGGAAKAPEPLPVP